MPLIPDFATLLNQAVTLQGPGSASYGTGKRNPIVFTSTLRQEGLSGSVATADALNSTSLLGSVTTDLEQQFIQAQRTQQQSVVMKLNPNSIRFVQPKRFTKMDVREGSVYHHFTNSKGQNNDILTMEFAGNTGNIDRRSAFLTPEGDGLPARQEQNAGAIQAILAWHNLYLLTREPMLLPDGRRNEFTITYISPLFPFNIDFTGFYDTVLSFEENARKPHSRDYSFNFIVERTEPGLDELLVRVAEALQPSSARVASPNSNLLGPNVTTVGATSATNNLDESTYGLEFPGRSRNP